MMSCSSLESACPRIETAPVLCISTGGEPCAGAVVGVCTGAHTEEQVHGFQMVVACSYWSGGTGGRTSRPVDPLYRISRWYLCLELCHSVTNNSGF